MTPLYAFVQDRARPEERARILSAMNLMDCVGGIVANLVLVKGMLAFHIPSWAQLLVMVPFTLAAPPLHHEAPAAPADDADREYHRAPALPGPGASS